MSVSPSESGLYSPYDGTEIGEQVITWKQRKNDLRKIVEYQNNGDITRIYTYAMADQLEADLRTLKAESGL
jgi:hypothetical protein